MKIVVNNSNQVDKIAYLWHRHRQLFLLLSFLSTFICVMSSCWTWNKNRKYNLKLLENKQQTFLTKCIRITPTIIFQPVSNICCKSNFMKSGILGRTIVKCRIRDIIFVHQQGRFFQTFNFFLNQQLQNNLGTKRKS